MSAKCMDCRFFGRRGCRVGVCGEVRAEYRAAGMHHTYRPLCQLRPEPFAPGGLAGFEITYGDRRQEFPPTSEGRQKAMGLADYMATLGVEAKFTELRRDLNISRGA